MLTVRMNSESMPPPGQRQPVRAGFCWIELAWRQKPKERRTKRRLEHTRKRKIFTDARCDLWRSEGKESYERARAAYVATEVRLLLALRVVGKEPASEAPASREPRRVPATPPYSRCTSGRRARALTQKTAEVRAERHLRYAWVPQPQALWGVEVSGFDGEHPPRGSPTSFFTHDPGSNAAIRVSNGGV